MITTAHLEFPTGAIPDDAWAARFPNVSCPRFGRMDALSRLALMAVELLGAAFAERDAVGVVLETQTGSLLADRQFLRTRSPSVFTYTLPSTAIGEICIRHKLRGPVLCLLTETGDGRQALAQAQVWLQTGEATSCLCLCADAPGDRPAEAVALYLRDAVGSDGALRDICRGLCMNGPRPV
jgi:3-oxoacyl-(acyl-carrier-protein) synthase